MLIAFIVCLFTVRGHTQNYEEQRRGAPTINTLSFVSYEARKSQMLIPLHKAMIDNPQ